MSYSFFVHRIAPRWRLVIAESGAFPERTTRDQWRHSRDRAEADTNPDVQAEVQRAGYCLFAISATFDELDRDLGPASRDWRPGGWPDLRVQVSVTAVVV